MDNEQTPAGYWVAAIIVVLLIAAAVWWYTASDTTLVPNTGVQDTGMLDYQAQ